MDKEMYKLYHRNYNNIYDLYNDLIDVINDLELEDNFIKIFYREDVLKIEHIYYGYITYLNDKKEKGVCEDQDIYDYAVEFAHNNIKYGICEAYDSNILDIDEYGISYKDYYDRIHFIVFSQCCKNWKTLHPNGSDNCVGERDIVNYNFTFFTDKIKTRIIFTSLFKSKRRKKFLRLQEEIISFGFKTYDLS